MLKSFPLPLLLAMIAMPVAARSPVILRTVHSTAGDLEVGGELAGLPAGTTRWVRYEDLLQLPQETYTVSDDTNFPAKTEVSGVALDTLVRRFGQSPDADLVVAICYDHYRANYPRAYLAAHHPLLVLRINGQPRDRWPKSEHGGPLGPFLISHPFFKSESSVLSHKEEPQIPYGVTRIELRRESIVYGAIRPKGGWPTNSQVMQGYEIARQDCFRCHNMGREGGTMAGCSWLLLSKKANSDRGHFRRIIRNPSSVTPGAKMPAHSEYDDVTLDALTAYFKTFSSARPGR
jgi:hypothetical protein